MVQVLKGGRTMREELEIAAPHHADAAAELKGPALPEMGAQVWSWFSELCAARTHHEGGANPIGYAEIEAWARLTHRVPQPWEIEWLRALDRIWLTPTDEERAAREETLQQHRRGLRSLADLSDGAGDQRQARPESP